MYAESLGMLPGFRGGFEGGFGSGRGQQAAQRKTGADLSGLPFNHI